jgi:hypothetical protein
MEKRILIIIGFMSLLFSCNNKTINATPYLTKPISTKTNQPEQNPTFRTLSPIIGATKIQPTNSPITNTHTPTLVKSIIPTEKTTPTPPAEIINPTIVTVCPKNREVPLENIGFDPHLQLLLIPPENDPHLPSKDGIWKVSDSNLEPQLIPNTTPTNGRGIYGYETNSNGNWLTYYQSETDSYTNTLHITSLDGKNYWDVIALDSSSFFQWINDKEGVIIGIPNTVERSGSYSEKIMPLLRINPFTLTIDQLPLLPENSIYLTYFIDKNEPHSIYYKKGNPSADGFPIFADFKLFSYNSNSQQPVFTWLTNNQQVNKSNLMVYSWYINTNIQFGTVVGKDYGIDMSMNLNPELIKANTSYTATMDSIKIPGNFDSTIAYPLIPENSIGIERFNFHSNFNQLSHSYVLNYGNMILKDYCINRENDLTTEDVSPDGKFIAYTFFDQTSSGSYSTSAKEVIILNLETGNISRIPNWRAIGWGYIPDEICP